MKSTLIISDFGCLVEQIKALHQNLVQNAYQSVNSLLTLRNWLIGYYISEYELKGADRAEYGEKLFTILAAELTKAGVPRSDKRELYRFCQFYKTYPQIVESLTPLLQSTIKQLIASHPYSQRQAPSVINQPIVESTTPQSKTNATNLINLLSYTHIEELLKVSDGSKRYFYENECIQGNWSVRELKRQISSLYYERSGLSTDKQQLSQQIAINRELYDPCQTIRDPYIFEFLGLKSREVMSESHLEDQLLDKLQDFLLELGHGFCFEARQKRILIGDTQYYIDLVFYHRILKCHILVELKVSEFTHENIGQLNTYVSWYRRNILCAGDNDPIGILLCTAKDNTLVEYALAGMDNQLFVSKYLLELPSMELMQSFIVSQLKQE